MKAFELLLGLVLAMTILACGTGGGSFDRGPDAKREANLRHAEAVDRLVPEEGGMRPARLRAVIEAIRTVRPDIPEDDLPVNYRAVRRVMKDMSYAELRRVEEILPSVEKRRSERGDD
jgi:hypothetical protein